MTASWESNSTSNSSNTQLEGFSTTIWAT